MKKTRYTEEQIIGAIKQREAGAKVEDICRKLSISTGTFYNWRSKYAGLEVNEAKCLRETCGTQYNRVRPHSTLNYMPPAEYARRTA